MNYQTGTEQREPNCGSFILNKALKFPFQKKINEGNMEIITTSLLVTKYLGKYYVEREYHNSSAYIYVSLRNF